MIHVIPQQAVILSSLDLPLGNRRAPKSLECDCACPIAIEKPQHRIFTRYHEVKQDQRFIANSQIVEMKLHEDDYALFNPLGPGGVIVVNKTAYQIFKSFEQPTSLNELDHHFRKKIYGLETSIEQLIAFGAIHAEGSLPVASFNPPSVLTAWLHVTNVCNLRCTYCYLHKTDDEMAEATGRSAIKALVDSATSHGFEWVNLKYSGGEASLNFKLVLILHDYAKELTQAKGLKLRGVMLTNGIAITHRMIDELKSREIGIMISLDGIGEDNDVQRPFINGKPSFRLVERTINRLIEENLLPHISITISNNNYKGLAQTVRFALDRNLTFSFNFFRDNECVSNLQNLRYQEQEMIDGLKNSFKVIEESIPSWSVLSAVLDRGQLIQPRKTPCGVGQDYVVIDQKGGIAKCHMEIEKTIGNVFENDPLKLIRQDQIGVMNVSVEDKEGCRSCKWKYWCSGGCPVSTYRATGRYDIKSPNCNIYKALYPEALRLEGLRILKYSMNTNMQ